MSDENNDDSSKNAEDLEVTIAQSSFNKKIGTARQEGRESERKRLEQEFQDKLNLIKEEARNEAKRIAEEEVLRLEEERAEKSQKKQTDEANKAITEKLTRKFNEGKEKIPDWDEQIKSYNWNIPEYNQMLPLLAQDDIDNPAEVLHHLCETGSIEKLAKRSTSFIMNKLKEISKTLDNSGKETSKNYSSPIKQLKPSHVNTKGDGQPTIEDFRKASWLKR